MATAPPYPQMPVLETSIAVVVLVVNLVLPGIGTIVAGVVGHQRLIGRGIAQLLLALIIVGWFWGLVSGVQALTNASWGEKDKASQPA
jgi:hypothetical protein